jgi:ABC-type transporter lipoprotein component MlaA/pimeloyl-ACP methyl ester carboxylesterase
MPDPIEPLNRGFWAVNHGLLVAVVQPTSRVYRSVMPSPARRSIRDFTRNITYPGRCLNHLLQGRWSGAGDESLRFLCNTTAGVGGLLDVASRWNLPKSEADFAQTFGRWGWQPRTYIMLPLLGPSDDCHAAGWVSDQAAEPWNYAVPYRYLDYATYYNELTDEVEEAVRFINSDADPYATSKYTWSYTSRFSPPDWQRRTSKQDLSTLQTLGVARITCRDPDFAQRGREMSVRLPSTGRNLLCNVWLQPASAPLVYVAPGIGSHRLALTTLSLAENLYRNGFSVVTTTSVFHPEFMERASTTELPAYPPVDCHDLLVGLTAIDRALEKAHPGMLEKRALVGFSTGGFEALYLAAREKLQEPGLLRFDRYVAIDVPVDLQRSYTCIDRFSNAAQAWPPGERQFLANNALHKVSMLATMPATASTDLPFDDVESKYLIGLTFRLVLLDSIFSSQSRHDLGVLHTPLSRWRREPRYQEILGYSYRDYFRQFVFPYYHQKGIEPCDFSREGSLMTYTNHLRSQPKIRVIINRNDFLLSPADITWLQATLGQTRLKIFPDGGHLGNLASEPMQKAVIEAMHGLK